MKMWKNPKLCWGMIIALGLANIVQALYSHKLFANEQNVLMLYTQEVIPEIVCIGDSLTNGTGGDGVSYPSHLKELLWEDSIYIPTSNLGVGGENTATIAGRMGAIPYRVEGFVIPKEENPVQIQFISEENKLIAPLRQGDAGINPCIIAGVEGRLTIEQEDYQDSEYKYYFTRTEAGEQVSVEEGTAVYTHAIEEYKDGIFIVFMGENHGFRDIDELIVQQKAILELQEKHSDKYIILGITSGTAQERKELEIKMTETYGDKYINLREYLSTDGPKDAKLTLSEEDLEQMSQGKIPDCLLSDEVHFNAEGYKLIAEVVYERMHKLGYFDEVLSAVALYGDVK